MTTPRPVPEPFHTITPYIIVRDAARAIAFYQAAFGAVERYRLTEPSGKIGHAELLIGNSVLMLADEYPDFGALSPQAIGGSPIKLHLYVDDVDGFVRRALAAGATELRPVKNEFHGSRGGMIADPFGHSWFVATQIEVVSPAEMQKRFTAAMSGS